MLRVTYYADWTELGDGDKVLAQGEILMTEDVLKGLGLKFKVDMRPEEFMYPDEDLSDIRSSIRDYFWGFDPRNSN